MWIEKQYEKPVDGIVRKSEEFLLLDQVSNKRIQPVHGWGRFG